MTIGQRLGLILKDLGITQKKFAERIGADPSRFSKTMNDKSGLGLDELQKIHSLFGINLNWLLTGKGNMKDGYIITPVNKDIVQEDQVYYETNVELMKKIIIDQDERIKELKEQLDFWKIQNSDLSKKQTGVK